MELDTTRLRSFLHVAELGTVAAAAAALGFTAPAVSQHVAKLEAQVRVPLFERVGGRLSLSAHGERLLPIAAAMIDLTDSAAAVVAAPLPERRVTVAGFASAIRTIVLPAMQQLTDVTWDVREAEDDDALRMLRLGIIDIAVVQEYDNLPATLPTAANGRETRLHAVELATDRLRLVMPPGTRRSAGLAEMAASGWLVNGSGTRCEAATGQVLADAALTPSIVGRVSDGATLFALVEAGLGATIAPGLMLRDTTADVVVSSARLGVTRRIVAVQRAATRSTTRDVVDALRSTRRAAHSVA